MREATALWPIPYSWWADVDPRLLPRAKPAREVLFRRADVEGLLRALQRSTLAELTAALDASPPTPAPPDAPTLDSPRGPGRPSHPVIEERRPRRRRSGASGHGQT